MKASVRQKTELLATTTTVVGKSTHLELISAINDEAISDFDEVVFAFQTWHVENIEGFYIRDLDTVVELMDIMMDRNYFQNAEIFDYFLDLCAKPLMELKANERLSTKGVERIERFFAKLSLFWRSLNSAEKIKLGKCFRCIANGGTDPAMLRSDREELVEDGLRLKVTDKKFLQLRMREAEALDAIVFEFIAVTELLNYDSISETSADSAALQATQVVTDADGNEIDVNDPAFYGVPARTESFPLDEVAIPEETVQDVSVFEEGASPAAEGEGTEAGGEEGVTAEGGDEGGAAAASGGEPAASTAAPVDPAAVAAEGQEAPPAESSGAAAEEGGPALTEEEAAAAVEAQLEEERRQMGENDDLLLQINTVSTAEGSLEDGSVSKASPMGRSVKSTTSVGAAKYVETPAVVRNLSQVMLDLCCELSADHENANTMCLLGICDGIITLMDKDSRFDPRENRISYEVELMWNCLESFLEQARADHGVTAAGAGGEESLRQYLLKSEYMVDLCRAVEVLKALMVYRLHEGYRLSDKELRNEIVIIMIMLAEFPSSIGHFMRSDCFNVLVTYACIEEMGRASWNFFTKKVAKSRNFATLSDIDLEFKKELWFLISACLRSNDPDALLCCASSPLVACLMQYLETESFEPVNPHLVSKTNQEFGAEVDVDMQFTYSMASMLLNEDSKNLANNHNNTNGHGTMSKSIHEGDKASRVMSSSTVGHSSKKHGFIGTLPLAKLREFQVFAMTFLVHNSSKLLGEFERLDGVARIVALMLKYYRSELPEHKALIFNGLILLNRCLINSLTVRHFMNDNNLIQTFLFLFSRSDHEETRSQAVRLISSLCSNSNLLCQKQLKALEGIPKLLVPVQDFSRNRKPLVGTKAGVKLHHQQGEEPLSDPLENPFGGEISILVVAILDCFGNAVVGNPTMEAHFADEEGMDTLLDLLEIAPFVLRIQVMRLIANILRNKKLTGYVNAWRSPKTLRSAAQIFCHCWLDEEVRLNGERQENGIICDIYNPFGNHQWPLPRVNNIQYSAANLDNFSHSTVESVPDSLSPTAALMKTTNGGVSASTLPNTKSMTVTKLATAILAGRNATQTNLPVDVCEQALLKDTRVVIAAALQSMGVFEMYGIAEAFNPLKTGSTAAVAAAVEGGGSAVVGRAPSPTMLLMPSVEDGGMDINSPGPSLHSPSAAAAGMTAAAGGGNISPNSRVSLDKTEDFNEPNQFTSSMVSNLFLATQNLGLNPTDRQVLSMAKKYQILRSGDWWQDVKNNVTSQGIIPIEADLEWMEQHLEQAFDVSQAVQLEQMELYDEDQRLKKAMEDGFIDQIIFNKNQQIKAEWLKKMAKTRGAPVRGKSRQQHQ